MKRAEVLWEGIYPRYLARKQQGVLLERLLPHILASKLPSFPPEVMQVHTHCTLVISLHHIELSKCHGTMPSCIAAVGLFHTINCHSTIGIFGSVTVLAATTKIVMHDLTEVIAISGVCLGSVIACTVC